MLAGLDSRLFPWSDAERAFHALGNRVMPLRVCGQSAGAMRTMLVRLMRYGTEFRRLEFACRAVTTSTVMLSSPSGKPTTTASGHVLRAFMAALASFLNHQRTLILEATNLVTLLQLEVGLRPHFTAISALAKFLHSTYDPRLLPTRDNPYRTPQRVLNALSLGERDQWREQGGWYCEAGSRLLSAVFARVVECEVLGVGKRWGWPNLYVTRYYVLTFFRRTHHQTIVSSDQCSLSFYTRHHVRFGQHSTVG